MLHLRKHAQDQGQCFRRGVTTMPWPRFKGIECFVKESSWSHFVKTILSNTPCWKLTWNLFLLFWFILLWLLQHLVLCISKHFVLLCFAFLKMSPIHVFPCVLEGMLIMYIILVLSYNTYSINNKLLWDKMALLLSYKWDQHLSTVYFKLLHSIHKTKSVSTSRNN